MELENSSPLPAQDLTDVRGGLVDCSGRVLLPKIESAVFINGANDMNLFTTMHLIGSHRAAAEDEGEGAGKGGGTRGRRKTAN